MNSPVSNVPHAILIGVQYAFHDTCQNQREISISHITGPNNYLPGIYLDLRAMYQYCMSKGIPVTIITDITCLDLRTMVPNAYFINLESLPNLLNYLREFFKSHSRTLLYYSGHCKNRKLLIPGNEITYDALSSIFPHRGHEVVLVFDCCNGYGLNLPFYLRRKRSMRFGYTGGKLFSRDRILCLLASTENENSITTLEGSIFTACLINVLKKGDLRHILEDIRVCCQKWRNVNIQTAMVYSSYPNVYNIPSWLG